MSPLAHICVWGNVPVAKVLLSHGADPNADGARPYPIQIASQNGYLELIQLLVGSGADVNSRDVSGRTPLHFAIATDQGTRSRAAELLLELGADPTIRDGQGRTPLDEYLKDSDSLLRIFGNDPTRTRELRKDLSRFTRLFGR